MTVLEYAQTIHELARVDPNHIPPEFTKAELVADSHSSARPWKGYVFKVLTSQRANAIGGARNYIVGSNMTLGYSLAAVPAEYGRTGKFTYIVNNNGTIFEMDYGTNVPADLSSADVVNVA